jgi:hypothetical protein
MQHGSVFLKIKKRSTKWQIWKVSKQFSMLVNWSTKVPFCDRYTLLDFATATPLKIIK